MKKWQLMTAIVLSCSLVTLTGCKQIQNITHKDKTHAQKQKAEDKYGIQSEIVTTSDILNTKEQLADNEQIVGLKVKITNNSKYQLDISQQTFTLTNDKHDQIEELTNLDVDKQEYPALAGTTLDAGQSVEGYLFYKVQNDIQYELSVKPTISYKDKHEKKPEIPTQKLAVKLTNNSADKQQVAQLAEQYIKSVFFNDSNKTNNEIANDMATDAKNYQARLVQHYQNQIFNNVEATKVQQFVQDLQQEGLKRDTISCKVESLGNDKAVVKVSSKTIDISKFDFNALSNQYLQNHPEIKDQTKFNQESQKYLLDELTKWLKTSNLTTNFDSTITLTVKDGKWSFDTNDTHGYHELGDQFGGDIDLN